MAQEMGGTKSCTFEFDPLVSINRSTTIFTRNTGNDKVSQHREFRLLECFNSG